MTKRRTFLGLTALLLVLLCAGCGRAPADPPFRFYNLTQPERKAYITDYLQQTYGLSCTISSSDVVQRQDGPFFSEDEYFAVAATEDGNSISVWVTEGGQITDTVSLLNRQDDLADYFTAEVLTLLPECRVDSHTSMSVLPTEPLSPTGDLRTYLTEQPTDTTLRIALEQADTLTDAQVQQILDHFSYCNIDLLLYDCDDLDTVDWDTLQFDTPLRFSYHRKPKTDGPDYNERNGASR